MLWESVTDRSEELAALCLCERDRWAGTEDAYILSFPFSCCTTTIRIVFDDESGADLAITNMTTLPVNESRKGRGTAALKALLTWAHKKGVADIRAIQVQRQSEGFWIRNSFTPVQNRTNDFRYMAPP